MKSLQLSVSAALSLALTFAFGEPLSPQERESLDFNGGG